MEDGCAMTKPIDKGMYRVLHRVGKGLSVVSDLLFNSSDRASAHHLASTLSEDVRRDWAYLLERHHGEVQSDAANRTSFDYAMCYVMFPDLAVRVSRGRHEIRVQVAAPGAQSLWEDLSTILQAQLGEIDVPRQDDGLIVFSNALQHHWTTIVTTLNVPGNP